MGSGEVAGGWPGSQFVVIVVVVSVGAVATRFLTGPYGSRIFFDPHRPYQNLFIANTLGLRPVVNRYG